MMNRMQAQPGKCWKKTCFSDCKGILQLGSSCCSLCFTCSFPIWSREEILILYNTCIMVFRDLGNLSCLLAACFVKWRTSCFWKFCLCEQRMVGGQSDMVGLVSLDEDVSVAEGGRWELLLRRKGWNLCYVYKKYCSQHKRHLRKWRFTVWN